MLDGRIDNRAELRRLLESKGLRLRDDTDAEFVLKAYLCWGEGCPERVVGDFAFGIWDGFHQRLFCARDHMGAKPLCYFLSDQVFVLASEVKAILALDLVPEQVNKARILDYLVGHLEGIDKTSTFFRNVFKMAPAHTLAVTNQDARTRRYWSLDPTREVMHSSDEAYAQAFREIFSEAVRSRLRGATPVASMMSGGLDSTSIVGMARYILAEQGKEPIRTFSAISDDDSDCLETKGVREMIAMGGIDATTISPRMTDVYASHYSRIIQHTDDPFDINFYIPMAMYAAARNSGVSVVLDGVDGDIITSQDTAVIAHLVKKGHWQTALREARGLGSFFSNHDGLSTSYLLWSALKKSVPLGVRLRLRPSYTAEVVKRTILDSFINVSLARSEDLEGRLATYGARRRGPNDTLRERHASNVDHPHLAVALDRYDRVASAFSLESRHPLTDKNLVEFCIALPWQQKLDGGWTKAAMRRAMTGLIPEPVRQSRLWPSPGADFAAAVLKYHETRVFDLIRTNDKEVYEFVDGSALFACYQRYRADGNMQDGYRLLLIMSLSDWLDSVDRPCV